MVDTRSTKRQKTTGCPLCPVKKTVYDKAYEFFVERVTKEHLEEHENKEDCCRDAFIVKYFLDNDYTFDLISVLNDDREMEKCLKKLTAHNPALAKEIAKRVTLLSFRECCQTASDYMLGVSDTIENINKK